MNFINILLWQNNNSEVLLENVKNNKNIRMELVTKRVTLMYVYRIEISIWKRIIRSASHWVDCHGSFFYTFYHMIEIDIGPVVLKKKMIQKFSMLMINLFTPFLKTLSISINSLSNTNIHLKRLFKVAFTSVYLAKSILKYKK